ncbi:hypothetical protein BC828DRAFT_89081 [Blastocladiella britannica]|nr:hypothetical protein BC828DRAFT_89081 [Blastocladiella britannica]
MPGAPTSSPQQPAKQYNARVTASPAGSRMGARPPHHSSLTDVHAQRVVAVLTEVLNKVDLLKMIPPVMDRRAQNMLGKELASEIEVSVFAQD